MDPALTEANFRKQNGIDDTSWAAANIEWPALKAIGDDAAARAAEFAENAAFYARCLQRCSHVHSVRWRVKDPEHLMAKIVRKRADKKTHNPKYDSIDATNYIQLVTDLIGLRALHLFKSQWRDIHGYVNDNWLLAETPIAYVRNGDAPELRQAYEDARCNVKPHPDGYRSVHYVIKTQPLKDIVSAEIQVRTIFEEGWSEIDHQVRYPNYSDNEMVRLFLSAFNRLAGNADEMGEFVRILAAGVEKYESDRAAGEEKEALHIKRIEELVQSLNSAQEKGAVLEEKINQLSAEVVALQYTKRSHVFTNRTTARDGYMSNAMAALFRSPGYHASILDDIQKAVIGTNPDIDPAVAKVVDAARALAK